MRPFSIPGAMFLGLLLIGTLTAGTIPFSGAGSSGTLATGQAWLLVFDSTSVDPGFRGVSVWGVPGLGAGNASWTGPETVIGFDVVFNLPTGVSIDQTPDSGAFNDDTRMYINGVPWTPTFLGLNEVRFDMSGGPMSTGNSFFVNVAFSDQRVLGPAGWTGWNSPSLGVQNIESVSFSGNFITTAVPEPGSLLLFGLGALAIGAVRRFRI